jgi:isoleucyl-tRNA synthetase
VRWSAPAELAEVIAAHTAHISDEVLALSFEFDAAVTAGDNELSVGVTLAKA